MARIPKIEEAISIDLSDEKDIVSEIENDAMRMGFIPKKGEESIATGDDSVDAANFSQEKDLFNLELLTEEEKSEEVIVDSFDGRFAMGNLLNTAINEVARDMTKEEDKKSDSKQLKNDKLDRIKKILKDKKIGSVNEPNEKRPGEFAEMETKLALERAAFDKVTEMAKEHGGIGPLVKSLVKQTNEARDKRCGPFKRVKWDLNDEAFLKRSELNELSEEEKEELLGYTNCDKKYIICKEPKNE